MKSDPQQSVFINCPFDAAYAPLFDAILFATVCCGFKPRSALESGNVSDPRMDRIVRALFESRYSIHDLSRNRGEGEEGFARFNMALELGMAVARRYMTQGSRQRHEWMLLVPDGHHYHRYISDLSGFDPFRHDGTVEILIKRVMNWLGGRPNLTSSLYPRQVLAAFPGFQRRRQELEAEWGEDVPWSHLVDAAEEMAPKIPG
jgi:hypothetical protein